MKFNKVENLVLDIIGADSAAIVGLKVPETWEETACIGNEKDAAIDDV